MEAGGTVIGAGALSRAARLGRMTFEDAADLTSVFVQVGARHARDMLLATTRQLTNPQGVAESARRRARR